MLDTLVHFSLGMLSCLSSATAWSTYACDMCCAINSVAASSSKSDALFALASSLPPETATGACALRRS